MCGRAVQTSSSLRDADSTLLAHDPSLLNEKAVGDQSSSPPPSAIVEEADRLNLSPGMNFTVYHRRNPPSIAMPMSTPTPMSVVGEARSTAPQREDGTNHDGTWLTSSMKTWGLVTVGGTESSPLPEGPSKHFAGLRFNARSETVHEKVSFRTLLSRGQACVVPLDGFYEWKERGNPYYVHRSDGRPLYVAGLYASVPTGRRPHDDDDDDDDDDRNRRRSTLHTFSILTRSAVPDLRWLHSRMPVILRGPSDVRRWLNDPTASTLRDLLLHSSLDGFEEETTTMTTRLVWHPVTPRMGHVLYRGTDCRKPLKTERSVASFFQGTNVKVKKEALPSKTKAKVTTTTTTLSSESRKGFSRSAPCNEKDLPETNVRQSHGWKVVTSSFFGTETRNKQSTVTSSKTTTAKRKIPTNHNTSGGQSDKCTHIRFAGTSPKKQLGIQSFVVVKKQRRDHC